MTTTALESPRVDQFRLPILTTFAQIHKPGKWSFCQKIITENCSVYFLKEQDHGEGLVFKCYLKSKNYKHERDMFLNFLKKEIPHVVPCYFFSLFDDFQKKASLNFACFPDVGQPLDVWQAHYLNDDQKQIRLPFLKRFIPEMIKTLFFIHKSGISHNDIKPANICIIGDAKKFQFHLIDFGSAKAMNNPEIEGISGPTPEYSSPEVFMNGIIGPGSDIYGTGVILSELAIGENLFTFVKGTYLQRIFGVLSSIEARGMGEIPEENVENAYEFIKELFTPEGLLLERALDSRFFVSIQEALQKFVVAAPTPAEVADALLIKNTILRMISIDPKKRPSAEDLIDVQFYDLDDEKEDDKILKNEITTDSLPS